MACDFPQRCGNFDYELLYPAYFTYLLTCRSRSCVVSCLVFMKLFYEQIKWWWWRWRSHYNRIATLCWNVVRCCVMSFVIKAQNEWRTDCLKWQCGAGNTFIFKKNFLTFLWMETSIELYANELALSHWCNANWRDCENVINSRNESVNQSRREECKYWFCVGRSVISTT